MSVSLSDTKNTVWWWRTCTFLCIYLQIIL